MCIRDSGSTGVVLSIDSVNEDNLGIYFCVAVNSINVAYAYVELGKIVSHCRNLSSQEPCTVGGSYNINDKNYL